jgi:hypothetical protein
MKFQVSRLKLNGFCANCANEHGFMNELAGGVTERPILFSAEMVRAILAGRKTQTRRLLKYCGVPAGGAFWDHRGYEPVHLSGRSWTFQFKNGEPSPFAPVFDSPYGEPGNRLWVKETYSADFKDHYPNDPVWFAADDDRANAIECRGGVRGIWSPESQRFVPFKWRPSIFMPRAMSRITLEITKVWPERLHDISEQDALAEGVRRFTKDGDLMKFWACDPCDGPLKCAWADLPRNATEAYAALWEAINGRGSWGANPWVWVVEFKRV